MMWFARSAAGMRVWFTVKQSSGALRTGLVSGDFFCSVANPADTASVTPIVTESTQRPGSYYFDVSSAFMLAYGVGYYSVVIVVDTFIGPSPPPNVRDSEGGALYVSQQLWDQLATLSGQATTLAALISINADTDDIQARLPATLVGGRMRSHVEALDSAVSDALVDAVWDEAAAGHTAVGSMGARMNFIDVLLSSRLSGTAQPTLDLIRKIMTNRMQETPGNPGFLTVWDDDDVTPLLQWEIRDVSGGAVTSAVGAPARRSQGA